MQFLILALAKHDILLQAVKIPCQVVEYECCNPS